MAWHREYTDEEIKEFKIKIIDQLANGTSMRKILRDDEELPSRRFVYQWLDPNNEKWFDASFSNQYAHAREESADIDFDRLQDIADGVLDGTYDHSAARTAADILKWTAGRKKPKKYGTTKVDLTSGGKELQNQIVKYYIPDNGRDNLDEIKTEETDGE
jgi:hypothetical protein